ncbi:MAG: hypothetical protein HOW73_07620 [Polyangiaceae bacterium]|nr:hypothetical protein [Polyangiaceae bacterium]
MSPGRYLATVTIGLLSCGPAEPSMTTASPRSGATAEASAHIESSDTIADAAISPSATPASAAPASTTTATAHAPRPAKVRYAVAAMGDSLTDPKSHGGKYLDVLREHCPKSTFDSFGKGGNMVNMMRKRFRRDVYGEADDGPRAERSKYTHVLILGGLGDVLSNETAGRNAEKIAKDIGQMVDWSRERGAKAIVLTLPPWGAMEAYNAEREKITADVNVWIGKAAKEGRIDGSFDTRPHLICNGDEVRLCKKYSLPDGIHWSAEGHRSVGEALYQAMFADCE